MTDPMLTGNPAIVTIEGSLRIIDIRKSVLQLHFKVARFMGFSSQNDWLDKKKSSKIKESRCQRLKTFRRSKMQW